MAVVKRGGKRRGAGRPFKYGEPQKSIRVPLSLIGKVLKLINEYMKTKEKRDETHKG